MSAIYNLHKQHGQSSGFQDLIFDLKMLRFSESLVLLGKSLLFLNHNKQTLYFLFQMFNFF